MQLQLFKTFCVESINVHVLQNPTTQDVYFISKEIGTIGGIKKCTWQKRCRKLEQDGQTLKYTINKFYGEHGVRDKQEQWILNSLALQHFFKRSELEKKQVQEFFNCLNTYLPHVLQESKLIINTSSEEMDLEETDEEIDEETDTEETDSPRGEELPLNEGQKAQNITPSVTERKFSITGRVPNQNRARKIHYDEKQKLFGAYDIVFQFVPYLTKRDAKLYLKDLPLIPLPKETDPMITLEMAILLCLNIPHVEHTHRIFVANELCDMAQCDDKGIITTIEESLKKEQKIQEEKDRQEERQILDVRRKKDGPSTPEIPPVSNQEEKETKATPETPKKKCNQKRKNKQESTPTPTKQKNKHQRTSREASSSSSSREASREASSSYSSSSSREASSREASSCEVFLDGINFIPLSIFDKARETDDPLLKCYLEGLIFANKLELAKREIKFLKSHHEPKKNVKIDLSGKIRQKILGV